MITDLELGELKLRMKRANFAGKTFFRHLENISTTFQDISDENIMNLLATDEEFRNLATEMDELSEKIEGQLIFKDNEV